MTFLERGMEFWWREYRVRFVVLSPSLPSWNQVPVVSHSQATRIMKHNMMKVTKKAEKNSLCSGINKKKKKKELYIMLTIDTHRFCMLMTSVFCMLFVGVSWWCCTWPLFTLSLWRLSTPSSTLGIIHSTTTTSTITFTRHYMNCRFPLPHSTTSTTATAAAIATGTNQLLLLLLISSTTYYYYYYYHFLLLPQPPPLWLTTNYYHTWHLFYTVTADNHNVLYHT